MNGAISVVMTTYNGSIFIEKQLRSIMLQTRSPDEVIIYDDASMDDTTSIIQYFIDNNKLQNWKLYINSTNIGWKLNFYNAISSASGDIIFFSDQDDIWEKNKIKYMSYLMNKYHMGALYGGKRIIDSNGKFLENRMEKKEFSKKLIQIPFSESFYAMKTLGCCMCVSKEIIDIYLNIHCPECGHDSQCGKLALLYSSLWYIDLPVIDYRIHNTNTSGISKKGTFGYSSLKDRIQELKNQVKWINNLIQFSHDNPTMVEELQKIKEVIKIRYYYLKGNKNIGFGALIQYKKYYTGISMLIGDFSYRHHVNKLLGDIRWKMRKIFPNVKFILEDKIK